MGGSSWATMPGATEEWIVVESEGRGIFAACQIGDFIRVGQILKADPDAHAVVNEDGDTPLLVAAERKQETVLRMLIRSGAEINYQNPGGKTALQAAASVGSVLCLSALLEAPTDTELQNSFGNTALTLAAANNHEAVVRRLLEAGAHPEHLNQDGLTPLLMAVHCEAEYTTKVLLEFQANANAQDCEGNGGLIICLDYPSRDLFTRILLGGSLSFQPPSSAAAVIPTPSADTETANLLGNSALIYASHCAHPRAARMLLEARAATEAYNKAGYTALLLAAKNCALPRPLMRLEVVMHLVEFGADMAAQVRAADTSVRARADQKRQEELLQIQFEHTAGWPVQFRAESHGTGEPRGALRHGPLMGHPETVHEWNKRAPQPSEVLTSVLAPVYTSSCTPEVDEGLLPLCVAAVQVEGASEKVASHMCRAGCNTELTDGVMDRTALMWAAVDGRASMVTCLIASGCAPNTQNTDGRTALMHAARVGNPKHINALLTGSAVEGTGAVAAADPNMVDANNHTALIIAIVAHQEEAVRALAPHTELNDSRSGFSPLIWAVNQGTLPIVQLLLDSGACASLVDDLAGWSALHHSVAADNGRATVAILDAQKQDQLEILRELLDADDKTPLMVAVRFGNDNEVKTLIGAGATGAEYHVPSVPVKVNLTANQAESSSQGLVTSEIERILNMDTPLSLMRSRLLN